MSHRLIIEPFGIVANIEEEETILHAVRKAGVNVAAYCNGQGVCGKCKIKIIEERLSGYGGVKSKKEHASPITETEKNYLTEKEIEKGYRFACMTKVTGDLVIEIPRESYLGKQVILEKSTHRDVEFDPGVKAYSLKIDKPTLEDATDDFTRVKRKLLEADTEITKKVTIRMQALQDLPFALQKGEGSITVYVLYGREIIRVVAGEEQDYYGLAIDVGTTTVAMYLCDMKDGKQLASTSRMNPQIKYGDDVLTRVTHCQQEDGLEVLQRILFEEINAAVKEMLQENEISKEQILETVIVCNTVMEHIALRISPESIGTAPFAPVVKNSLDIMPKDLGLDVYRDGNVHWLPGEAAFVGADNVAVLIAEEPYKQEKMKLIIDIGTNSEICLGNAEKMYCTSCATGPALEGAQIFCGMRAAAGAICKIEINPLTLEPEISCIPGMDYPIGICGSGIIDAVAQMALTGIIEADGKFSKNAISDRVRKDENGKYEYVLYFAKSEEERDIVVKQKDVRAVQLAKAALYAGAKVLMTKLGITEVDEIVLAGGFGSYIDKKNALNMGVYPDCELEKVVVSGNAAGMGAKLALRSVSKREEAREIAKNITFIETATDAAYQTMFAQAMTIPHEKDAFYRNKQRKWACVEQDNRAMPKPVLEMGTDCLCNIDGLEQAIGVIKSSSQQTYIELPLMQNIEAKAYGGNATVVGNVFSIRDYQFKDIETLPIWKQNLIDTAEIQTLLQYIKQNKEEKIILDIEGPFTILAGLVGMNKILRMYRKEKELVLSALDKITEDLITYTVQAIEQGIELVSLAEPEGSIEIVGKKFYSDVVGYYLAKFMKGIEGSLKKAVIHICGKTSVGLSTTGYVVEKQCRAEDKSYMDLIFGYAKDRRTRFIGYGCMRQEKLLIPIVTKLELADR